jgi:hypothetical protein
MDRGRLTGIFAAALALGLLAAGCDRITARRITGQWESEATPRRTLILHADGSYLQRFSGKTLGFVSELLGPETGRWRVEKDHLVLSHSRGDDDEVIRRLRIEGLSRDSVMLAGEHWDRLP